MWDIDPSLFEEKCRVLSFLRIVGLECYSAVSGKISASPPSSVWFLFHLRDVKRSLYQFLRFFRGNFPYIAVNSVSLEGDEFRVFLCRCLESLFFFLSLILKVLF